MCSLHFAPDAYKRDLYAELTGKPAKKRLESLSTPTRFLKKEELEQKFSPAAIAVASALGSSA
jgi:hypothetical protein